MGLRAEVVEDHPCFNQVHIVDIDEVELVEVGEQNEMALLFVELRHLLLSRVLIGELFSEPSFSRLKVVRFRLFE